MHLLCIGKTSHSLNFKWRAVIKNNRMCGASGDLHATASDGREEAVRPGSTQAESDSVLEHTVRLSCFPALSAARHYVGARLSFHNNCLAYDRDVTTSEY